MELQNKGFNICNVYRLKKGKGKEITDSLQIKIVFEENDLPSHISLFYQRFQLRQYVERPWQCFNCQGYGHNAKNCKSASRCLLCAGNHKYTNCINAENKKCANCKENHAANYNGCLYMKKEKYKAKLQAHERISYAEAAQRVKNDQEQTTGTNNGIRTYHSIIENRSNARIVARDNSRATKGQDKIDINTGKTFKEMGTQTEDYQEKDACNQIGIISAQDDGIKINISQLCAFIVEALSSSQATKQFITKIYGSK